jgi:hypothetical protein
MTIVPLTLAQANELVVMLGSKAAKRAAVAARCASGK